MWAFEAVVTPGPPGDSPRPPRLGPGALGFGPAVGPRMSAFWPSRSHPEHGVKARVGRPVANCRGISIRGVPPRTTNAAVHFRASGAERIGSMETAADISNAQQLGTLIEGRSDSEIIEQVQAMGEDSAIEKVFDGMTQAFLPAKAGSQSAVIQWNVKTPAGVHSYQLNVSDGKCVAAKGTPQKPRVTLSVDLPTFLRVITGNINGQQAFFTGKLKLDGDMMFAMTQESWFDKKWGG